MEGHVSGEHNIKDDSEGEDIGFAVVRLIVEYFGGDVARGAAPGK